MKYAYGEDIDERTVIAGLLTYGNITEIKERGAFSLLDFKQYLAAIGYSGAGYKLDDKPSFEQFQTEGMQSSANSIIIPLVINGNGSFSVFRGYDENYIYFGHPILGNICISFTEADDILMNRIIFIVSKSEGRSSLSVMDQSTIFMIMDPNSLDTFYEPDTLTDMKME